MNLHEDPLLFRQIIEAYGEQSNIPNAFIEKDYWLSGVLKNSHFLPIGIVLFSRGAHRFLKPMA